MHILAEVGGAEAWWGVGGAVVGALVSGFITHYLSKDREVQKERREAAGATEKERKALEAALHISDTEREILRQCVATDGFERGRVWIIRVDTYGPWIRAGKHDFMDQHAPWLQARYMDAFDALFGRGYFRSEGGTLFQLTGAGFERAQHDT